MTIRRAMILVISVLGICRAGLASAQPAWGHERYPNSGACFYENANYEGRYFCVRDGERVSEMPHGMNDKISSIRLFGNAEVAVWKDHHMSGRTIRFVTSQRNLKDTGWNDQISSLEVFPAHRVGHDEGDRDRLEWGRSAPVPAEGACFYEDNNFRGRYFCVRRGGEYAALGGEFNRAIRSIRVFNGARVRIYLERDFRGRMSEVVRDVPDLHGTWRDNIESLSVR
jgi:beta/gamma crystallin/peptidase inhibitor family I36